LSSLRARLNLGILVGITLILALNGVLLYMIVRGRLLAGLDGSLATVAQSLATQIPLELRASTQPGSVRAGYVLTGVHLRPPGRSGSASGVIPEQTLWARIDLLRSDARSILIDGVDHGLEEAGWMAHLLGMESVVLVPLGADHGENGTRIDKIIEIANRGEADVVVLGREVIARGVLTEAELGALLRRVRTSIPKSVLLTTADSVEAYLESPELLGDIDFLFPIYDPFTRGVHIDGAVQQISCWHQELVASARGKEVVVAQAGWPSAGDGIGDAVPSSQNAARFFTDFVAWARLNDVRYYYASGVDETPDAGAWGYRASTGALKPGMQTVFDGLLPDLGEPGLTLLPSQGPDDLGFQSGVVSGVPPFAHGVAVYLHVRGKWWNKPSFFEAMTPIGCDGSWTTDITTGVGDEEATSVIAFLLPIDYVPPMLDGTDDIPRQVFDTALAIEERNL